MKSNCCTAVTLCVVLLITGCRRQPTADQRLNRRGLDAVLTAITLKNQRLLEESFTRAKSRHGEGQYTDTEFEAIEAFVAKARNGNWKDAENDAYRFRKAHPFVAAGN